MVQSAAVATVGLVIVLEEYPVLNPAKRYHNPLQPRHEAKGGGIKGGGSCHPELAKDLVF